jgi:hypothetical protein
MITFYVMNVRFSAENAHVLGEERAVLPDHHPVLGEERGGWRIATWLQVLAPWRPDLAPARLVLTTLAP